MEVTIKMGLTIFPADHHKIEEGHPKRNDK